MTSFWTPLLIMMAIISPLCTANRLRSTIALIDDFVAKFSQQHRRLNAIVDCWRHEDQVTLARRLQFIRFANGDDGDSNDSQYDDRQLNLVDLRCDRSRALLRRANESGRLSRQVWLIVDNDRLDDDLDVRLNSSVYVLSAIAHDSYRIRAIYKLRRDDVGYRENDVAIWRDRRDGAAGFVYYDRLMPARNRSDLNGIKLPVSYVLTDLDSLNHMTDYRDIHIDPISKFSYLLTHEIVVAMLNASVEFVLRRTWGYRNATSGRYSGMVGDLQSGLAEIGGTALFFSADRLQTLDYVAAPTKTYAKFIFRAPPLSYVTNVFARPFATDVWLAVAVLFVVVAIVVYFIVRVEWSSAAMMQLPIDRDRLRPKFLDVLLMETGAVCQQGAESEPASGGGRVATIFFFVAAMFVYTSYSANIVALLQSTTDRLRTVDDLLDSHIKLGVDDKPYSRHYFQIEQEPRRKLLYERKIASRPHAFMSTRDGIARVRREFFAFHVESAIGYKIIAETFAESEKCGLMEIDVWRLIEPYNVVRKHSVYKELVKIGFRRLHEHGIQSREFRLIYTKKPICQHAGSNFISVGLIDCYFAFLVFAVGSTFPFVVLIIEMIVHRRRGNFLNK